MKIVDLPDSFLEVNSYTNKEFLENIKKFIQEWNSSCHTIRIKTSGSTGIPKILEVEKQKMLHSAEITCDFLGLKEGDIALICLPIEYISGKMMVVRAMWCNMKLLVSNQSLSPINDLENPIDFCAMTPLQVENSLDKIHLIKNLIIGGASVSEQLKRKLINHLSKRNNLPYSVKVYETYGMSETLSHIALKEIYPNTREYFKILKGIKIDRDERDCLAISAPYLLEKKLITNDIVELKNDKEFKFLGRADNVINSGGAKIYPEILEALVKRCIDAELVFIGLPDETFGQKLVIVVEGEEDWNVKEKLKNIVYEKSFHRPKAVLFVKKIPRTPNGKVSRLGLIEHLKSIL